MRIVRNFPIEGRKAMKLDIYSRQYILTVLCGILWLVVSSVQKLAKQQKISFMIHDL